MHKLIAAVVVAVLLGGCATYAVPVPPAPAAGVYVEPAPVVIDPVPWWWSWHGGWYHGGWHAHWR